MVKKVSEILVFRKHKVSDQTAIKQMEKAIENAPGISGEIDSEHIKDGSIQEEDLTPEVQGGLHELDNEEVYANNSDVEALFNH